MASHSQQITALHIAIGRDFAGVHYRSDALAGLALGEELALALVEARGTGNEMHDFLFGAGLMARRVEV